MRVVAFVTDDASMAALRVGLLPLAEELDIRRGTVRQAIRFFEKQVPAQAVIVDVTGIEDAQATLDDLARVCPPDVQVFVVGENTDITFYRLLVHDLGVTEYLPKPLTRDSIQRLLLPRLAGGGVEPAAGRGGHVVAVCGARGGVGATTIAVSLALELSDVAKAHVALLDLHLQGGTAALMLSGRPGPRAAHRAGGQRAGRQPVPGAHRDRRRAAAAADRRRGAGRQRHCRSRAAGWRACSTCCSASSITSSSTCRCRCRRR